MVKERCFQVFILTFLFWWMSKKKDVHLEFEVNNLLGRLGYLMRNFVETKKRVIVEIPEVDEPTIKTSEQIEDAFKEIPRDFDTLIISEVVDMTIDATTSLDVITKADLLARLATFLMISGCQKKGGDLFAKLAKKADRTRTIPCNFASVMTCGRNYEFLSFRLDTKTFQFKATFHTIGVK